MQTTTDRAEMRAALEQLEAALLHYRFNCECPGRQASKCEELILELWRLTACEHEEEHDG
jgi:hypothetical protein